MFALGFSLKQRQSTEVPCFYSLHLPKCLFSVALREDKLQAARYDGGAERIGSQPWFLLSSHVSYEDAVCIIAKAKCPSVLGTEREMETHKRVMCG